MGPLPSISRYLGSFTHIDTPRERERERRIEEERERERVDLERCEERERNPKVGGVGRGGGGVNGPPRLVI